MRRRQASALALVGEGVRPAIRTEVQPVSRPGANAPVCSSLFAWQTGAGRRSICILDGAHHLCPPAEKVSVRCSPPQFLDHSVMTHLKVALIVELLMASSGTFKGGGAR